MAGLVPEWIVAALMSRAPLAVPVAAPILTYLVVAGLTIVPYAIGRSRYS